MGLNIKDTVNVMVEGNKGAFKESAKRRTGTILNDRLVRIVGPRLPLMVRGYADTELGRAALANIFAAGLVHFGYNHPKLITASEAMVNDAMDKVLGSFNIEEMVNELLDGVDLSPVTDRAEEATKVTKTVLKRAAGGE